MKIKTQKIVVSAMLAALCCIATMIIKIPSPFKGYINLGDGVLLLSAYLQSPLYAFLSAAVGSAMADIFSGYIIYAPATFVIKGIMAISVYWLFKILYGKIGDTSARIISGIAAETIMILGYFIFEGVLYGFVPSAVNVPANAVQGAAGIVIGTILIKLFKKSF